MNSISTRFLFAKLQWMVILGYDLGYSLLKFVYMYIYVYFIIYPLSHYMLFLYCENFVSYNYMLSKLFG